MDLLKRISKSRVAQTAIGLVILYWIITLVVPFDSFREILDGVIFALSIALVAVYLPLASEEMVKDHVNRSGRLLISMVLFWMSMAALRGLSIYGRGFGQLNDISDTQIFGFILWAVMWAAILGLAAPSGDDAISQPFRYRNWIVAAIAIGCTIGGFFLGLQWRH